MAFIILVAFIVIFGIATVLSFTAGLVVPTIVFALFGAICAVFLYADVRRQLPVRPREG